MSPADGSEAVPVNADLLVASPPDVVALFDDAGNQVATEIADTWQNDEGSAALYRPTSPLAPNSSYVLRAGASNLARFSTGDATDSAAPATPLLASLRIARATLETDSICGGIREQVELDLESDQDVVAYEVKFLGEGPSATFLLAPSQMQFLGAPDQATCRIGTPLAAGEAYCVEVKARDIAGNVSEAVRECSSVVQCESVSDGDADLSACEAPGCCSTSSDARHSAGLVALLALTLLGRRRPRPPR